MVYDQNYHNCSTLALKLIKKYIVMVFKKVVTAAKARPQWKRARKQARPILSYLNQENKPILDCFFPRCFEALIPFLN
jgi:hypothetical protein